MVNLLFCKAEKAFLKENLRSLLQCSSLLKINIKTYMHKFFSWRLEIEFECHKGQKDG